MGSMFKHLWRSVALSNFTDGSLKIFLPFVALSLSVHPSDVALVFTFLTLGWPLFGLLSGIVVDRLQMKSIPFWCHAIRFVLFGWLAIVASLGEIGLYHLYVAAFVFGLFDVLFEVSLPKLVLDLTSEDNRVRSNTRLAVTHTICSEFLGPVLGAGLSLFNPALGLATIAIFYAISAGALSFLVMGKPGARPAGADAGKPIHKAVLEPVLWLLNNQVLLILALVGFGISLSWGAWFSLQPYYLIETEPRTLTKFQFGFLMSVLALGAIVAALLFEKISINKNNLMLLVIDAAGVIGLLFVSSLTKNPYLVGAALFLTGFGATIWSSIVITMRQERVPERLLGGVNGFFRVIVYAGFPLGSFAGGFLADQIAIPSVYLMMAAISALFATLIPLAQREHRKMTVYS